MYNNQNAIESNLFCPPKLVFGENLYTVEEFLSIMSDEQESAQILNYLDNKVNELKEKKK